MISGTLPNFIVVAFSLLKTFVTLFWKTGFPSAESLQFFAHKGFEIKSTPTDV